MVARVGNNRCSSEYRTGSEQHAGSQNQGSDPSYQEQHLREIRKNAVRHLHINTLLHNSASLAYYNLVSDGCRSKL